MTSAPRLRRLRSTQAVRFSLVYPLARPLPPEPGDQTLAAAVAIHIGRVDEGDAAVNRDMQGADRDVVVDGAPRTAYRPGPETHGRDPPPRPAQNAIVQGVSGGSRV